MVTHFSLHHTPAPPGRERTGDLRPELSARRTGGTGALGLSWVGIWTISYKIYQKTARKKSSFIDESTGKAFEIPLEFKFRGRGPDKNPGDMIIKSPLPPTGEGQGEGEGLGRGTFALFMNNQVKSPDSRN
jgi:hypothetical protein